MTCISIKFLVLKSVWQNVACQHLPHSITREAFFPLNSRVMMKDGKDGDDDDDGCDILSLFLIFLVFCCLLLSVMFMIKKVT